MQNINEQ